MISERIKKFGKISIILVIFIFLARQIYLDWSKVGGYDFSFNYYYLILAIILMTFHLLWTSLIWWMILKSLNAELKIMRSMKIWFLSLIARYIPGKVGIVIGRLEMCKKDGISRSKTIVSIILELALLTCSGALIFLLGIFFFKEQEILTSVHLIFILLLIALVLLLPFYLKPILNLGLKLIKREQIEFDLKYKSVLFFLLLYSVSWIVYGSSLFLLVSSIYELSFSQLPQIGGIFVISWIVGFLSFLTPGGIGVREGVSVFLLKNYIPVSIAILASIIGRILISIIEIVLVSFFGLSKKTSLKKEPIE